MPPTPEEASWASAFTGVSIGGGFGDSGLIDGASGNAGSGDEPEPAAGSTVDDSQQSYAEKTLGIDPSAYPGDEPEPAAGGTVDSGSDNAGSSDSGAGDGGSDEDEHESQQTS